MKRILFVLLISVCARAAFAAQDKGATEATAQAIQTSVNQLDAKLQTLNSNVTALNATLQSLSRDVRTDYGGLEYVLMAIAQAFYFALGLVLFYIFDRGRLARDIW